MRLHENKELFADAIQASIRTILGIIETMNLRKFLEK